MASRGVRHVDVTVNGCKATIKIDPVAEVTVVTASFPRIPYRLDETQGQLPGPGNQPLSVAKTFAAALSRKGKSLRQKLYVMEAQITPLLSLPAIEELEAVRSLDAADHVSDDVVPNVSRPRNTGRGAPYSS